MKSRAFPVLIVSIVIICLGSKNKEENKNGNYSAEIEKWVGDQIILPTDIELYCLNSDTSYFKQNAFASHLKIVSYINGSCSTCIYDLKKWHQFIQKYSSQWQPIFLFYVYAEDELMFKHINRLSINFQYPVLMDNNNSFFLQNELSENKMLQTFLVDKNGKVILIGSPIYSEKLKKLYISEIEKHFFPFEH